MAEVKRRGSIITDLKIDSKSMNKLVKKLNKLNRRDIELLSISIGNSKTAEDVKVALKMNYLD